MRSRPSRQVRPSVATPILLALLALQAGCAPPSPPASPAAPVACKPGGGEPMLVYNLFFGQAVPDRHDVTEAEWVAFVEQVLTPALPAGFTILDARGAWLSPRSGRTIHEASRLLVAALPDTPASHAAITRVRTDYQARFRQQLVGLTMYHACGHF